MKKNNLIKSIIENIKTLLIALFVAILIRSLIIQPFHIPSSSMEPTLLVGDRIFVSKITYGYSKHSFPFSPNFSNKRLFARKPNQGDLVVFKTPADNRTDYIKRLIGLPGDEIQLIDGNLFINGSKIVRKEIRTSDLIRCGNFLFKTRTFLETLPNGVSHLASYNLNGTLKNTKLYKVPKDHYFLMGDNRDCSKDSRFLDEVGYVNSLNLVGKAKIIFFSNDTNKGSLLKFWNIHNSFRVKRTFQRLK